MARDKTLQLIFVAASMTKIKLVLKHWHQLLGEKPYRVSWKADGTRYMMLIAGKDQVHPPPPHWGSPVL